MLASLAPGPVVDARGAIGQPRLVGVRAGRNKDFDRLVLDFEAPAPGVQVQYVDQLLLDGSGSPVPLRGRAVVEVVIRPAVAHRDDGTQATALTSALR